MKPALVLIYSDNPTVMIEAQGSRMRVAMVGDAEEVEMCSTIAGMQDHAVQNAWPTMEEAIERNRWEAEGSWLMCISSPEDGLGLLADDVRVKVEEKLREPDLKLLYVTVLVDSNDMIGATPVPRPFRPPV